MTRDTEGRASPLPTLPDGLPSSSPLSQVAGPSMAIAKAKLLAGQFRRDDAADPETFAASWAAVMSGFPPVVLDEVCHPAKGIATKQSFLPSVHELREELITVMNTMIARWRLDQLPPERRAAIGRGVTALLEQPRHQRPSYDDLKAKYGDNWGIDQSDPRPNRNQPFKVPTLGEVTEHYLRLGTKSPLLKRSELIGGQHDYGNRTQEKNHDQSKDAYGIVADAVAPRSQGDEPAYRRQDAPAGGRDSPQGEGCQEGHQEGREQAAEPEFG